MTTVEQNVETLRKFGESLKARDWVQARSFFSDDFVDHNQRWHVHNLDDLIERVSDMAVKLAPEDMVNDIFGANDKVVIRVNLSGIHKEEVFGFAPTGKKIEWEAIEIYRFNSEGKICELWFSSDMLGILLQLGLNLPEKHQRL